MKKYIMPIIAIVALVLAGFLIAGKKEVYAPSMQEGAGPMRKINLDGIDQEIISACNEQLRTMIFDNEIESDRFFLSCTKNGGEGVVYEEDLTPQAVQNPSSFTGELEKVDTGCFADGECFVIVDGKHVTVLVGRRQGPVGQVIGIETGFGGLEGFIGKNVSIFASKIDDQHYTLYGNNEYYIKVELK